MISIAIINNKGGVGKTAVSSGIAYSLAVDKKKKVLLIDTDPQGNLSRLYNKEPKLYKNRLDKGLYACLVASSEENNVSDFIESTDFKNIDILVGTSKLDFLNAEFSSQLTKFEFPYESILSNLKENSNYDVVIFDTRPSLGAENTQILAVVDSIIIPSTVARNSIEGMNETISLYKSCKKVINKDLKLLGVVLNQVKPNTTVAKIYNDEIRNAYGNIVFNQVIKADEKMMQAEHQCVPVAEYMRYSKAAMNFRELTKEVWMRIEKET